MAKNLFADEAQALVGVVSELEVAISDRVADWDLAFRFVNVRSGLGRLREAHDDEVTALKDTIEDLRCTLAEERAAAKV